MRVLRWGEAEYERGFAPKLPPGVEVLVAPLGDEAPLETADVLVVPSLQRVRDTHVPRLRERCRLVLTTTSGFDHVDTLALAQAGIPCARLPLARRDAVVETTLGMILSLTRRLGVLDAAAAEDRWARRELPEVGASLLGCVGVVGAAGVIGARMVAVLEALGARVLRCDPKLPDSLPLESLLERSDVLTLHCSLTPGTHKRIDSTALARMKPGAVLVNTARGGLVEVEAAVEALRGGKLGGLGLDVFPEEPAALAKWRHPRAILTPHAAGWHPGLGQAIAEGVSVAVAAILAGDRAPWALEAESVHGGSGGGDIWAAPERGARARIRG
jgi:phosphoglycerate dehydrogenase-like enzyme